MLAFDRAKCKIDIFLTVDGKNFAPHELHMTFGHACLGQAAPPAPPLFNIEVGSRDGAQWLSSSRVKTENNDRAQTRHNNEAKGRGMRKLSHHTKPQDMTTLNVP